jgi:NAD(P)-dependent dehydrogenase (short-subunit alcohol dehydrogenase family)
VARPHGETEEITNDVRFPALARASYITGVNLTIDGAQSPIMI